MRKNFINKSILVVLLTTVFLAGCGHDHSGSAATEGSPAHTSSLFSDSTLPDLTKPVNEHVLSNQKIIRAEQGAKLYTVTIPGLVTYDTRKKTAVAARVAGRIERLYVHYNNQPVQKGQLLLELYSPDLVAAQRELLLLHRAENKSPLLEAARRKLVLLGMSPAAINKVLATGEPMYRVGLYSPVSGYVLDVQDNSLPSAINLNGTATPMLVREGQYLRMEQLVFTIYQNTDLVAEFAFSPVLNKLPAEGKKILYYPVGDSLKARTGKIRMIQPVYKAGQQFTLTRLDVPAEAFKVGELLQAEVAVMGSEGWWLPVEAVLVTGSRSVVFRKSSSGFEPVHVTTGIRTREHVQVLDNISNWELASNAYYLVDSESFIPDKK